MKNFEEDSTVLLQGESHHFKDPKAMQSASQTDVLLCLFFFSYKYAAKVTLQKASCMQSNMKKYRTKAVTSILGTISSPTDPRSFLADLLHSIFGIVILQQWNPCPEFLDDIKCPFAAVDYLVYYFHHSIPAKSIKSKPSVILEEQTQP